MSTPDSFNIYIKTIQWKLEQFHESLKDFLNVLTLQDAVAKHSAGLRALNDLRELNKMIAPGERKPWLEKVEQSLGGYVAGNPGDNGVSVLHMLFGHYAQLRSLSFASAEDLRPETEEIESIYLKYFDESKLPALFDELVFNLERIINSGQIDSIRAQESLERLVAAIRKNASGTAISRRAAITIAKTFIYNLSFELLEQLPFVAPVVKATRATVDDLSKESTRVDTLFRSEVETSVKRDFPFLDSSAEGSQRISEVLLLTSAKDASEAKALGTASGSSSRQNRKRQLPGGS